MQIYRLIEIFEVVDPSIDVVVGIAGLDVGTRSSLSGPGKSSRLGLGGSSKGTEGITDGTADVANGRTNALGDARTTVLVVLIVEVSATTQTATTTPAATVAVVKVPTLSGQGTGQGPWIDDVALSLFGS